MLCPEVLPNEPEARQALIAVAVYKNGRSVLCTVVTSASSKGGNTWHFFCPQCSSS